MQSCEKEFKTLLENVNRDFQSISSAFSTPLKEGGFNVGIMIKKYEERMNSVRDKIGLTSFDFSKVVKSEIMSGMCTL